MSVRALEREFLELPIGLIDDPDLPSRSVMDEQKLDELAADIRDKGLLQPISVFRDGDRYQVIAGHRRRIACARIGLALVPCLVYASRSAALEGIKYSENRFREDLNAADEAIWFAELLERDCDGDVDRLCEQLGEKRHYVEGRLLLFRGDPEVFRALQEDQIRLGVAAELNRCTDEGYRRYLLHQAIVGGATRAIVANWIGDWQRNLALSTGAPLAPGDASPPAPAPELNYFTCYVCRGTDNPHAMRPVNVHTYCQMAILDKLLAAYRGDQA